MSTPTPSAARAIWRARRERTGSDTAYALYAVILVAVIVGVPIVRAVWIVASSPSGLAVLTSVDASATVSVLAAVLWAGALLVGRRRGPALLPAFLLQALTSSGIRRSVALRRPVLQSAVVIVAVCAAGALLVGLSVFSHGQTPLWGVVTFVAAAISTGVVTTVMWLTGQALPRAALPLALTVLVLAGVRLSMPPLLAFTPWGWVGATYLPTGSGVLPLTAAAVLAIASLIAAPLLLDRLTGMQLAAQAAQWERATAFSFSFDLGAATSVYETAPRLGRRMRAISPCRHRWVTFFIRDVIGQARTPSRSLGATVTIVFVGVLMTLSYLPGWPSVLLAGVAGVLIYGASGPLTKGLQHAASIAGDYPVYGISDRRLVALHTLFPLTALLTVLPLTATATALATGTPVGLALTGACAIGVLTLALRFGIALKGPLPPTLLAPVSTPVGDLSIVMQVGWALSDPLLAILGALTITMLPTTPIPFALLTTWTTALIATRWKNRR